MKKFTSFLLLMFLAAGYASAQPSSMEVEPGSKGNLPTLPTLAPLAQGHFAGLEIYSTGMTSFKKCFELRFPQASSFGATCYYLQYKQPDATTWQGYGVTIEADDEGLTLYAEDFFNFTDFRLYINDGPNKGYVSNAVTVDLSGGLLTTIGYSESEEMYKVVGAPVGSTFELYTTTYTYHNSGNYWTSEDYTNDDGYYKYKWFRMNPNTYEMTLINGANESTYTPTLNDCGYMLVMEVTGDDQHCSLQFRWNYGEIVQPIQASIAYVGDDGFVLNTDYVVPTTSFVYLNDVWDDGDYYTEEIQVPNSSVSQKKAGQYAFRIPRDEYDYHVYDVNIPGTMLTFVYLAEWNDPPTPWYREAQVMSDRYMKPLTVKPVYNGTPVETIVEVYAPNIDDELVLYTSAAANGDEEGAVFEELPAFGNGCYVKALRTENTSETYYPSAQLWTEATPVMPALDEEWNPICITINLKPVLPALTGPGVIEGTVNVTSPANARHLAPADVTGISVYLQKKGGDIIACEQIAPSGDYRFENVPLGSYEILVNVDGFIQEQTTEVTLTNDQPTVSNIDYYVNEDNTITTTPSSQSPTAITSFKLQQGTVVYDLQGRRLEAPQKGVNIIKFPDGKTRQVVIK